MANVPSDAVPGPIKRLKLNEPYPSVDPNADAYNGEVIARNIKRTNEDTIDPENDDDVEVTTITNDEIDEEIKRTKRSPIFKTIFTRAGIYTMLESRLNS